MRNISSSRFQYSEKEMADAFQDLLLSSSGLPGLGIFDGVYREISCRQGRPDFLALKTRGESPVNSFPRAIGLVGASIISILKPYSLRTFEYLKTHSEFTPDSIKKSLRHLLSFGLIERIGESYRLGEQMKDFTAEIWAFELKLDNPKRAVFQAQQCCSYAERTIIVVPPNQAKNYERYNSTLKRWSIGLATYDPITQQFQIVTRSCKTRASSKEHKIYALSQIFSS